MQCTKSTKTKHSVIDTGANFDVHLTVETFVTVFWKTDHLHTRSEIHLLPVRDRHTHALSRNTK